MKRTASRLLPLLLAVTAPAASHAQGLQFGNLSVTQLNFNNNPGDIVATLAPGGSAGASIRASATNRGDYALSFGNASDPTAGVLISSARQNGRDDSATGNTLSVPFYATTASAYDANGYWVALFHASRGDEVNMDVSFGFFPYSEYLGGYTANAANNTALNSIIASPGIQLGTGEEFQNTGTAGQYLLNLTALGGHSAEGVLLVTGAKNEDNFANSRPNADGTFSIFCKDNDANTTGTEADPVAFVYLPASGVGTNKLAALGRVNSDASTDVAAGAFTLTKGGTGQWYLTIPGQNNSTGVLLLSPEWGGAAQGNMLDNIVSFQWDAANNRWVIESRDITNTTTQPALQDGINADEDVFSFAFFTNGPINQPPDVALTAPTDGSTFAQGPALELAATASDSDGTIAKVEFYDGTELLGEDTTAPYTLSVALPPLGLRSYTARAFDSSSAIATSAAVKVSVQPPAGTGGLFFDGVNDYVTFGNNSALGLSSFTLELWFRRDGAGLTASSGSGGIAAVPLIAKGRGESDGSTVDCNYLFGIQGNSGRLAADFEDLATGLNHPVVGTTVVPSGVWQHAAVTFDAGSKEWRLYLNGGLEAVASTDGQVPRFDSIQHAALAAALNSTGVREGAFFGVMDEVRIWNVARTQAQIQGTINTQLPSASGLVARYAMSEGSGTTLSSTAGTTINGTLTGGPAWTSGAPFNLNSAPAVALTAPADGVSVMAPASFMLTATASDVGGSVAQVEFFRDGQSIGVDTTAPYTAQESALGSGVYLYTAVATDNLGASATSDSITVTANFDPLHPPANTALRFDGVDDYVTMGTALELGLGGPPSNGMTLECWFRKEGAGITSGSGSGGVSGVPLFGKGRGESDGSNIDCDYFFGIDAQGRLVADFETYPGTGLSSGQNYPVIGTNAPIENGVWHHAAVTYDGPTYTWKLFLDGVQVGTALAAPNARPRFDSIQHFGIATAMNSSGVREGTFAGRIDEVRVWNYVRSSTEIAEAMTREIASAPGLVARYGLNEAAGTVVANSSHIEGLALGDPTGTLMSAPRWVEGAPFTVLNTPPSVTLTAPTAGDSTVYPAPFTFTATATDNDDAIVRVEFYVEGVKVGEDTTAPYAYAWTPPAVGDYEVFARAVDDLGAADTSAPSTIVVTPNPNQPPVVAPTAPAHNTTGIGGSTTLTIAIEDPEGDATTVTFYGRKTVPATPGPDFTLVTIPDTQYYSQNTGGTRFIHFLNQTNWIVAQRDALNVAFVSHMGDIVENGDSIPQQWVNANQAMTILEDHATTLRAYGVPFGAAPGNHDQASIGNPDSPSAGFNQYFPAARYVGRPYWGGNYGANNDNNYQLFSASGLDFIIIHLEYRTAADPAVIAWADALLKAHPHRRAIVTSHWIIGQGNPAPFGGQGQGIYDGLKNNPNLFLLLCGHIHAEGRRADVFEGRTVYSFLQDYQGSANGGNGFLRHFRFSPASNTITATSYSPSLGRAVNSTDNVPAFEGPVTVPYNMQSSVSDWITLGTVQVPAGGTAAALAWTGLEAGSHYEWQAHVHDGINAAQTAAQRFSTAPDFAPSITLDAPLHGVTYTAPATLTLAASATDPDGTVARVDFFQGTTKLGSDTTAPFTWTTGALAAGSYTFSAVAADNSGDVKLSNIVTLTVANRTNTQPTVALTAPSAGSPVQVPATITFAADATDADGAVTKVAFYVDGALRGEDTTAPYALDWTGATPGSYTLTAVATDNDNATKTSAPVTVQVAFTPTAATADTDGDLLDGLLEHALALPAATPNRTGLPTLGTAAGGALTLSYQRAVAGLTYTVQASSDLENWSELATNSGAVGSLVTVTDADTASPHRYLRLLVSDGVNTTATTPVGRMTYVLAGARETAVTFPLQLPLGAIDGHPAGFISALGAATLDDATAGWTPGALSQAATPYLVRITSGAAAGRVFPVSTNPAQANTATRLTLVTGGVDLTTLGLTAGTDTYELVPADTLASLFPSGTLLPGTATSGDTVRLWSGTSWITFFHNGAEWRRVGAAGADRQVIRPDEGLQVLRRGAATTLVFHGQVPAVAASVSVARSATSHVALLPLRRTFAEFALHTRLPGWTSNPANPTTGDHVRLWSGTAWVVYYLDGAVWRQQGGASAATAVLLEPGRPVLIFRPTGSGRALLSQDAPY